MRAGAGERGPNGGSGAASEDADEYEASSADASSRDFALWKVRELVA